MKSIPWRGGYEPTAITLSHPDLTSDRVWDEKTVALCSVHDNTLEISWIRLSTLRIDVTAEEVKVTAAAEDVEERAGIWHWPIQAHNGWVRVPLGELQTTDVVQALLEAALPNASHLRAKCVPDTWHDGEVPDVKTPLPSMWYENELFLQYEPPGKHLLVRTAPRILPGRSLAIRSANMETETRVAPRRELLGLMDDQPLNTEAKRKRPREAKEAPWIQKIEMAGSPYGACGCQKGSGACSSGRYLYNCETGEVAPANGSESYVAMSYVWSENSWKTMRRAVALLADCTHCRYFWIDQLCINQQCAGHKREQVPQMGDVYRQARLVACMVPKVTARLPDEVKDPAMVMEMARYLQKTLLFKHQLKRQPWSQRVWTWQEGLLGTATVYVTANDVVEGWVADNVLCAESTSRCWMWNLKKLVLEKPDLVTNISGLPEGTSAISLNLAVRANHTVLKRRWTSCQTRREEMEQWGVPTDCSLTEALKATRDRKATEKIDEIYAVLGMVRGGSGLCTQYGISREDALQNALKAGLVSADLLAGQRAWYQRGTIRREPGRSWMPKLHNSLSVGQELGFNEGGAKVMSWSHEAGGAKTSLLCLPLLRVHPEDWDDGYGDVYKFWILQSEDGRRMAKVPALSTRPEVVQKLVKLALLEGPHAEYTLARLDDVGVLLVPDVDGRHYQFVSSVSYDLTDAGKSCLVEEEVVIR